MSEIDLTRNTQANADGTTSFRATRMCEVADAAGGTSLIVDRAWITYGTAWGGASFTVTFLDSSGTVLGGNTAKERLEDHHGHFTEAPKGSYLATIEGVADAGAIPTAELIQHAKA